MPISKQTPQDLQRHILSIAREDDRIRAVILNGSRVNPRAPADIFQDFDVMFLVRDVEMFKNDPDWIEIFGPMMILQLPDDMGASAEVPRETYAYLMQLLDGNRIDLTLAPYAHYDQLEPDSLSLVLLDKDGALIVLPEPSDSGYLPEPPTAKLFADSCNEFWWLSTYVAKGLWRRELAYARAMFEEVAREELTRMLTWSIGIRTDFKTNPGYRGKWLEHHLPAEVWDRFVASCPDGDYENTWDSLLIATELFRETAQFVARHFDFEYPDGDDQRVSAHLRHVRRLPRDAKRMY
jgi:aminoglycoside 6-adenylyltransferase